MKLNLSMNVNVTCEGTHLHSNMLRMVVVSVSIFLSLLGNVRFWTRSVRRPYTPWRYDVLPRFPKLGMELLDYDPSQRPRSNAEHESNVALRCQILARHLLTIRSGMKPMRNAVNHVSVRRNGI
ncbi:hypothetical protein K503DRAFT_108262 [Rhizopogon vinicolor AM-OR11-026]|uniref:Uncharacterized protein n=1 Tax=Rhizopogon vinicolor AM-OR11-026 TaxID=1314800 RepID=A0A1B7NFE8_9AGAM|nr:hypothetical protein K503DRAFT_108262 [Rhizopogon vinicolor AM-OR11-026]